MEQRVFQFGVSSRQNEFPVGFCFNSVQKNLPLMPADSNNQWTSHNPLASQFPRLGHYNLDIRQKYQVQGGKDMAFTWLSHCLA